MDIQIVEKPWGHEEILAVGDRVVMKRLVIEGGKRFSLQYHNVKEEIMLVELGMGLLFLEDRMIPLSRGKAFYIRPGMKHRIEATSGDNLSIIEASTAELTDIVRLQDDYSRAGTTEP